MKFYLSELVTDKRHDSPDLKLSEEAYTDSYYFLEALEMVWNNNKSDGSLKWDLETMVRKAFQVAFYRMYGVELIVKHPAFKPNGFLYEMAYWHIYFRFQSKLIEFPFAGIGYLNDCNYMSDK